MDAPKGSDLQQPKSREIVFFKEEASSNRQNLGRESTSPDQGGSFQSAQQPTPSHPALPQPFLQILFSRKVAERAEGHWQGKEWRAPAGGAGRRGQGGNGV